MLIATSRTCRTKQRLPRGFLTPVQDNCLSGIFKVLGESRINRTQLEYKAIAGRAPNPAVLHRQVNRLLHDMALAGFKNEICTFRAGDHHIRLIPGPVEVSLETVRQAWANSGMRALQLQHRKEEQEKVKNLKEKSKKRPYAGAPRSRQRANPVPSH